MVTTKSEIKQYKQLMDLIKEITLLRSINGIIGWDYEVMMPKKGVKQRSEEMSLLSGLIHNRSIDQKIGALLNELESKKTADSLTDFQKRNVALVRRDYDKDIKIPAEFARKISKHGAISTQKWKEAKSKADYKLFRDELAEMIELKKKEAEYLDPDGDPYDVLLNNYEYGFNKSIYDKIFTEVKTGLIPIIKACVNSSHQPDESLILRHCPREIQQKLAHDVVTYVNYDIEGGRIDEAVHPFTTGYFDDVRFTVAYDENDFTNCFYATMHEVGHALYEQNYPQEYKYLPVGTSSSSAMHEGQARFIENVIGRSPQFWNFYLPKFKKITGKIFADVEQEAFIHAINKVSTSKIRIHADPVTYSLHIILRYELEKELFNDKLTVDELPSFWNQKMSEYLDIDITNDAEGILQDTHYAWGLFGYFPTYSLGSYYNAQFLTKMTKDVPEWETQMSQGQFNEILNWLNKNIRNHGRYYDPLDLVKNVTGKEFSAKYFIDRTKKKYSKLYQF